MSSVIQPYNAKVTQILGDTKIGKPTWPIYYGAELEFEVKTPVSCKTKEEMNQLRVLIGEQIKPTISSFAFTKHDGSLKNGFEIVTLPMTLESYHKGWIKFFNNSKNKGLEVKPTCGMHVHASREILTPLQIGKIMVFIFSPENNDFIWKIAGRKPPQQYAEMNPKKIGDVNRHVNRYSALNLTGSETIEFRLFKGTLSKELALKNIEFCDALIRFTWPSRVGLIDLRKNGVECFCKFVEENKTEYPYLYNFLISKKFISTKLKKSGRGRSILNSKKKTQSSLIGFLEDFNEVSEFDCSFDIEEQ